MYVTKKLNKALAYLLVKKLKLRSMQQKRLLRVTKNDYPYYGIQIKLPQLSIPPLSQDFDGYTSGKELVYNPSETLQLAKRLTARAGVLEIVRKERKKLEEATEFAKAIELSNLPDPFTDEVVAELAKSAGERVAVALPGYLLERELRRIDENEFVYNQTNMQLRTLDDGTEEAYS